MSGNNKTNAAPTAAEAADKTEAQQQAKADAEIIESLKAQLAEAQQQAEQAKAEAEQAKADKEAASKRLDELSERIDIQVSKQEEAIKRQMREQRKVRIRINSGRDTNERGAVTVAVNGREFLIVRDEEVDVPEGILNVLNLAVEQTPTPEEENGQTRVQFKPTMRFAYTVLGYIDPATGELVK